VETVVTKKPDLGDFMAGQWMIDTLDNVFMACPGCGLVHGLSDHEIAPDGLVTPSVVCSDEPNCSFHAHVRLADWEAAE
jgi:hypothetical protein